MIANQLAPIPFRGALRLQSMLGLRLSLRYEAIVAEPPPEEFLTLLRLADHTPDSSEQMG